MGRKFSDRYEAESFFFDKGMTREQVKEQTKKINYDRYWHEAEAILENYHSHYSLKKHLEGYGSQTLYGFELEIERITKPGEASKYADEFCPLIHQLAEKTIGKGIIRTERDGSLTNGVEIIFAPLSEQEIRAKYSQILKFLKGLKKLGFTSHDPGTCGFHIHITKPQATTITRIENLVFRDKKVKEFWNTLSRRGKVCTYSKMQRQSERDSKYFAINKFSKNTLEFRLFRGTLLPSSFFASIESVFALVNFVQNPKFAHRSWKTFVEQEVFKGPYRYFNHFVNEHMNGDFKIPPPKVKIKYTKEEQEEMKRIRKFRRDNKFVQEMGYRTKLIDDLYRCINSNSMYIPTNDSNRKMYCVQLDITLNKTLRDVKLMSQFTPVMFKEFDKNRLISEGMFGENIYRPLITIIKNKRKRKYIPQYHRPSIYRTPVDTESSLALSNAGYY